MIEDFTPQDLYIIKDLESLRTLADPLRTQIYEILIQTPATIKQIGDRLGLGPSRLYYHVSQLEKIGLIKVVETRMVANMVEKVYRAIAYSLEVAPELLNFNSDESKQAVFEMLTGGLDATRDDLLRSIHARLVDLEQGAPKQKPRSVLVNRTTAFVPDAYAEEFNERLQALIKEFSEKDTPYEEGKEGYQNFALMIAFYPSFYY